MSQGLRIVHCFRSPVGGIFRHVRDLADAQAAAGHKVGIVCDSSTGGDYEARLFRAMEPKLELGVRRTPMQRHVGLGDIAAAWRTFGLIRELQPDILHGHSAKGGVYSRVFGSLLRVSRSRVARLYSPHGGSLHYSPSSMTGRATFMLEGLLERVSEQILFVSEYEQDTYRRKVGEPKVGHRVIYNGVTPAEFEPVLPAADASDFLYIGMMRDLKGPDIFIDALGLAENALGRPLTAVMVGSGDDRDRYVATVAERGMSSRVTFLDPMPARQAFALARTVVVPSRAEALPYIVLEALAAGRPMIASAVGGIPEIFAGAPTALVTPDPVAIAGKMALAVGDPDAWAATMPRPADIAERFSVARMAQEIEAVYRSVLP
ncbi:glycosyltransferase family 4 protein [Aquibium microcysteis]|uniref:glycosyltransferase family 4 protein n=1 Tax=Aquibium microcysteis TaxID=675281 RepID=UPI00165CF68C|nr:glycosyltransferase family 4 protein [Aquibium microcysteis]